MDDKSPLTTGSVRSVEEFARHRGFDEALAKEVFEREMERLDANAKVRRYLPLLAEKHTREILRIRAR